MSAVLEHGAAPVPIDPRLLDEAAGWLVQLHSGAATDADREAWRLWRTRSSQHALAWDLAERLKGKLNLLPPAVAMPVLAPADAPRRAALRKLALLVATVPAGWVAWRAAPVEAWTADVRTPVGAQRELQLADGSLVTLNTSTSLDVRFDALQRLLVLHAGEILVRTAPDGPGASRPFRVRTPQGGLRALGTQFVVREGAARTHVSVLEGAVEILPRQARGEAAHVLHAGSKASFSATAVDAGGAADPAAAAWADGMMLADKMPLADFAVELARYRPGIVRCDPALAGLVVSGAFPIRDTDRTLQMLQATYPVRPVYRTRYWVALVSAEGG